jgi:hypothetical protein
MKKVNLWVVALFTMLLAALCAGVANAQSQHGQATVLMGDYILPGFGEVSTPELGNQFHRVGIDAFYSLDKRETVFLGVAGHSWSRYNSVVNSASPLIKGRLRGDGVIMELSAGPTLQHRGHSAVGGTVIARGEFRLGCDSRTTLTMDVRAEAGGRGLFYDQAIGLRHRSFEARFGVSSVTQGQYLQVNYFTCERYSLGITYAWDRAMNTLLESQGLGESDRQALGFQAAVHF